MPSQTLLQRLSKFLRSNQSAVALDSQAVFSLSSVGSTEAPQDRTGSFAWPDQIGKIVGDAAAQLASTAAGEGWNIDGINAEDDDEHLWTIQSLLMEATTARNLLQRTLNRFQSSQDGQGGFTPAEMTEIRQETMNIFDRLLNAALAKWIVGLRKGEKKEKAGLKDTPHPPESGGLGGTVLPVTPTPERRAPSEMAAATLAEFRDSVLAVSALIGKLRASVPSGRDEPAVQAVRQLQRMTTLLESLGLAAPQPTAFSAPEPIRVAPVAVRAFMEALADAFRPIAERKGLRLAMNCDSQLASVETDAPKLHRAASLLIGNAINYTVHGGITLTARAAGPDWVLVVEDTGPGIDPTKLCSLMTGLALGPDRVPHGIAVSRELVGMLGGHIDADSVPRRGSSFTIRLPRGRAAGGQMAMRRAG